MRVTLSHDGCPWCVCVFECPHRWSEWQLVVYPMLSGVKGDNSLISLFIREGTGREIDRESVRVCVWESVWSQEEEAKLLFHNTDTHLVHMGYRDSMNILLLTTFDSHTVRSYWDTWIQRRCYCFKSTCFLWKTLFDFVLREVILLPL